MLTKLFQTKRDIITLAVCWALTLTTSTLLTTIGPLTAKELGASNTLSPFTIGMFLIGSITDKHHCFIHNSSQERILAQRILTHEHHLLPL